MPRRPLVIRPRSFACGSIPASSRKRRKPLSTRPHVNRPRLFPAKHRRDRLRNTGRSRSRQSPIASASTSRSSRLTRTCRPSAPGRCLEPGRRPPGRGRSGFRRGGSSKRIGPKDQGEPAARAAEAPSSFSHSGSVIRRSGPSHLLTKGAGSISLSTRPRSRGGAVDGSAYRFVRKK